MKRGDPRGAGAAVPGDEKDLVAPRHIGNLELLHEGSFLFNAIQNVIRAVNQQISPAVVSDRFYRAEDQNALEFHGRWGTFRVRFRIAEHMLGRAYQGELWLAREMERLIAEAIDTALRTLVQNEMAKMVSDRLEAERKLVNRAIDDQKRELLLQIDQRFAPKPTWYRRVWKFLLRPVW